jgi:hypothetical protein
MVTGAFLAESATAVDHKLNVMGGVIEHWIVDPTRPDTQLTLVALTQTQHGETRREVEINIRPPEDGADPVVITGPIPEAAARGELGFAFFVFQTNIFGQFDGRWVFEVSAGGNTVSFPLNVRHAG